MKLKLTDAEKKEAHSTVAAVFAGGERWETDEIHHPAGAFIEAIEEIPGVTKVENENDTGRDGFSTNGWEYDWWQRFGYQGKNYILSGSGYYGGHSFGLEDE